MPHQFRAWMQRPPRRVTGRAGRLNPAVWARFLRREIAQWPAMYRVAENWVPWIARQMLRPFRPVTMLLRTRTGNRFVLADDPVDDAIIRHVCDSGAEVYFPPGWPPLAGDDLVLDVGAHHAIYAVELLRRNPGVRVIAVEPNAASLDVARRNIELNGLTGRVELVEAALGARDGAGLMVRPHGRSWGDRVLPLPAGGVAPAPGAVVRIVSVASLLRGRLPRLVKLNAEGAEFEVVPELLRLGITPEMMVLFPHKSGGDVPALLDLLRNSGYGVRDLDTPPRNRRIHCLLDDRAAGGP